MKGGIGGDDAKELSPVGGDSSLVLRGMGCWAVGKQGLG